MKRGQQFKEGDNVFAKIKGYPAWPAVILGKSGKKFSVKFYGTGETGSIKAEDICYYLKNKEQMVKGSKKKEFKDAIEEIENAIAAAGGTDGDNSPPDENTPAAKRKRSNSEKSSDSNPSKKKVESDGEGENTADGTIPKVENDADREDYNMMDDVETNNSQADEDLPFLPNVKIVSELNLKNWIIYADAVKENPDLYKTRSVDPRHYYENQVFPVLLPTGKYAGLKLHKNWPLHFTNEYDCAMYDNDTASRVLLLKESVTSGEVTVENDPDAFLDDFDLTETEIRRDAEMKLINNKYKRVERLRAESSLVELDAKIKNCLGLNKADPKKALEFLDNMLEVNIDEVMLKKHSHIVEMIRRLRKYVGNVQEWNLSVEEVETFNTDAQKLRNKADEVYKKLKSVVKLPAGSINFWDGFNDVVRKFREDCIHLNNREVFVLCAEPYSRQAIIDRLEQEEELQEADIHRPILADPAERAERVGES